MDRQPVLFVSHGAPLLAIDPQKGAPLQNLATDLATRLPQPQGVLVVSAHWEAAPVTIGSNIGLLIRVVTRNANENELL